MTIFLKKMVIALMAMMMVAGCSRDDDIDSVNTASIVGNWEASHQSKNPNVADTADMWAFTFNSDGTGSGPFVTDSFRYNIEGNHITLTLMNTEAYYGQVIFRYEIVSLSKDRMEWNEITYDHHLDNSMYLKFYRKK